MPTKNSKNQNQLVLNILNFVFLVVLITSVASIIALVLNVFVPKIVVLLSFILSLVLFGIGKKIFLVQDELTIPIWSICLVIILSMFFRAEPYFSIYGGQDQGLYTSMSAHFQKGGEIFMEDDIKKYLQNEELLEVYNNNLVSEFNRVLFFNTHPDIILAVTDSIPEIYYQPGVYFGGNKHYVFQFYHLHPIWMAIFGDIFGDNLRFYSLTFFSILSILALSLIAFELTLSSWGAIVVGLLMATNPLHAFFSKSAVTEVVALAFIGMGLYIFLRTIRLSKIYSISGLKFHATFSASLFAMYFFVRISGFIFLPFFLVILFGSIYCFKKQEKRLGTILFSFSTTCLILYAISVLYGLTYSPIYSKETYWLTFDKLFGDYYYIHLVLLLALVIFLLYQAQKIPQEKLALVISNEKKVIEKIGFLALGLIILFFSMGVFKYVKRYWMTENTSELALHSFLDNLFTLGPANWVLYVSPFLVIYTFFKIKEIDWDFYKLGSVLFLLAPLFYVFYLKWNSGYQYYYSRYMMSEAIPFSIVFGVFLLFNTKGKNIYKYIIILSSLCLFIFLSSFQLGIREGERPYKVLSEISSYIEDDAILFLNLDNWTQPVDTKFLFNNADNYFTPLKFYFGKRVFGFYEKDMDLVFNNIPDQNKETYLLSPILFDSTLITIKPKEFFSYDNIMERGFSIPTNRWENVLKQNLFVYKLPKGFKFPKNIKMMSDEKKEIAKFYNQYLKRRPHQSELNYWEKQVIEAHFNYNQIEQQFLLSVEYYDNFLKRKDNRNMVRHVFNDIFQRMPTEEELEKYTILYNNRDQSHEAIIRFLLKKMKEN